MHHLFFIDEIGEIVYPINKIDIRTTEKSLITMTETHIHSKKQISIGICILLFLFVAPISFRHVEIFKSHSIYSLFTNELYTWFILLVVYMYAIKIEKRSLLIYPESKLQLKQSIKSIFKLLLSLIGISFLIGIGIKLSGIKNDTICIQQLVPILRQYKIMIPVIALTAGIVEELVIRGYLFPRFEELFGNTNIAKSTLSQRLNELKDAGLIQGTITLPTVKYCVNKKNLELAKILFSSFFQEVENTECE